MADRPDSVPVDGMAMSAAVDRAPTIDLEVFEGLREQFGTDVLVGLAGTFCERAPLVNEVVVASRGHDGRALARLAHRLHDASSILAATRLAELCQDLERLGRRGEMDEAAAVAAQVASEYVRAVAVMSEHLRPPEQRH
jgi:HPt (histidine-containing phosphotransfer) domain-containing protein